MTAQITQVVDHILVFFESPNGRDLWRALERENIPDWLRDHDIIKRMMDGETVRNADELVERHYRIIEVDRPRPEGQHKLMAKARQESRVIVSAATSIWLH